MAGDAANHEGVAAVTNGTSEEERLNSFDKLALNNNSPGLKTEEFSHLVGQHISGTVDAESLKRHEMKATKNRRKSLNVLSNLSDASVTKDDSGRVIDRSFK